MDIDTPRLTLIPMDYPLITDILSLKETALPRRALTCGLGWPRGDTMDILTFLASMGPPPQGSTWVDAFMIVTKDSGTVIGDCGFKGGPDESGMVEIGYGLIETEWRKGYGTEAVQSLIRWAFSQEGVKTVMAECLESNTGSIRILEKTGMERTCAAEGMIRFGLGKIARIPAINPISKS